MDLVDLLEKEIYAEYGNWFGKTVSFTFNALNWKQLIVAKMNQLKKYHLNHIGDLKIKKINWNSLGDCLEWHLEGDSWIKFRMSGTEPKFKIYYNLYANNHDILLKQYNNLNGIFKKLLGV
jgi:phosphomannomutase